MGGSVTWRLPSTPGKMRSKTKARQALNLTRRKLVPFRLVPLPLNLQLLPPRLLLLLRLQLVVVVVRQISVSSSIRRVIVNALATPAAGCQPAGYVKSAAQNFKTSHVAKHPCPYPCPCRCPLRASPTPAPHPIHSWPSFRPFLLAACCMR